MSHSSNQKRTLIDKLDQLPPERVAEVEDFVDFLRSRDQDRSLTRATSKVSEASFKKVWDNPDDAAYDQL
ncbi:MAG: toxin-antitoxin system, antitoxin component, Xre family protein [Sulfuricaulis sp.]